MITIYHNTRCGKSRTACIFAGENNIKFEVYEYLKDGLTSAQITEILTKGKMEASEIIRRTETVFKENYKGKELSRAQWIQALIDNPILLQRPVIVGSNYAMILRSDEALQAFLAKI